MTTTYRAFEGTGSRMSRLAGIRRRSRLPEHDPPETPAAWLWQPDPDLTRISSWSRTPRRHADQIFEQVVPGADASTDCGREPPAQRGRARLQGAGDGNRAGQGGGPGVLGSRAPASARRAGTGRPAVGI